MNKWEENARDYIKNGMYKIDERLLSYYSNIVNYKNKMERDLNEEILKRRLMAMCIVNIEVPCVNKGKENISKVFSNGYKITIDRSRRLMRYIAVKEVSKDDTRAYNEKLYDESMNEYILDNLKIAYKLVGLNDLGTVITDRKCVPSYADMDSYNIWRDVYHTLENEYVLDANKAKILLDRVYTGKEGKKPVIKGKGKFSRLQYNLDCIYYDLQSNKVESAIYALELSHIIHNICVARRKILNMRRERKGLETNKHTYFVMTMQNDLGAAIR